MPHYDEFSFESQGLDLLSSLYAIRAVDKCIQTQRTCNFCIMKVLNALTDDLPREIAQSLMNSVEEVVNALLND